MRQIDKDDLRYFYAGYRMGAFDKYFNPPKDWTPQEFSDAVVQFAGGVDGIFTAGVDKPCFFCHLTAGDKLEPHVVWMPWASPRNKIECVVKFVEEMNDKMLLFVEDSEKSLYFHIRKYGIIRYVGELKYYYDSKGHIFEAVKK